MNRPDDPLPGLTREQRSQVAAWLPGARLVRDHSWGLVDTAVLQLQHGGVDVIVKAAGPGNSHIGRELTAHETMLEPWTSLGRAPRLLHGNRELNILVASYLPGDLVQGSPAAADPETYRQAGALLAALHTQGSRTDECYEARMDAKALAWLDQPHRIDRRTTDALRRAIAGHPHDPVEVVPTHGDYQTRNWLVQDGTVSVIDLGRAQWRPAHTDLARLASREFLGHPEREEAFLRGYGVDPREPGAWRRTALREAIGTAAWAFQVGDRPFEEQGHRMIAAALRADD